MSGVVAAGRWRRCPPRRITTVATRRMIVDSAEWAWWISDQHCLSTVDPDMYARHASRLHAAAVTLLAACLPVAWARYGYTVVLVPATVHAPPAYQDRQRRRVANDAVAAIDPGMLMRAVTPAGEVR